VIVFLDGSTGFDQEGLRKGRVLLSIQFESKDEVTGRGRVREYEWDRRMGRRVEEEGNGREEDKDRGQPLVDRILVDLKTMFICRVTLFGSLVYPSDVDTGEMHACIYTPDLDA
jgi:hypothetical protein